MNDSIEFMEHRERRYMVALQDRWEFKPHGRFAALWQRLFTWAVGGGHFVNSIDEKVEVTRYVVKPDSVIDALFRQRVSVARHFNRDVTRVLMGPDDYEELMGTPGVQQYVTFPAQAYDSLGVIGLSITIVPWMRGILVVP